jgi:3-deoxy-D-manno-octulosonic-acid transferase
LSPRSERRWRKRKAAARAVWGLFDLICVPEEEDVARFQEVGADATRIIHTGNIKFDQAGGSGPSREDEFRVLAKGLGFGDLIIVAGSTWAPEEALLAECLGELRATNPEVRLILAPRHVERTRDVERAFAKWRVVRRSALQPGATEKRTPPDDGSPLAESAAGSPDVLLVDTTGELRDWYRLATIVFVGKSMPRIAEVGGQNPGEPAALGKAVVFGPHMENFAGLCQHLLAKDAAVQVRDVAGLRAALGSLLADAGRRAEIGARAQRVLTAHAGATERTAAALSSLQKE